jgi:hypothetical protein
VQVERLDVEWTPGMFGDDQGRMLAEAIADRGSIMVMLGGGADEGAMEEQVYRMVKAAAPETRIVARARATLDSLMEERGEIPYRVTLEPGGTDVLGRPYYLPKEHPLSTDWLARRKVLKGADAMLVVRPVDVDDARMRQIRDRRRGSCQPLEEALGRSMAAAVPVFEPFFREADDRLEKAFSRHLAKALPFWRDEVDAAAGRLEPGGDAQRCLGAYREYLERYAGCVEKTCLIAPRAFPGTPGVVGMDQAPELAIPQGCPAAGARDYPREMRSLGARAVEEVLGSLGEGWAAELLRLGALERLGQGIRDECAPRHRRLSPQDLAAARDDVTALATELAQRRIDASWVPAAGQERAPGTGPVTVLARARAVGEDPATAVTALLDRLRGYDRCRGGGERLLQATLIDVGSSEVVFMGIFFEEQLLCEDLAPGQP